MNLLKIIKNFFKREEAEPDNDYVTRQVVIDSSGVHEVFYHNRCTDYIIGDVLPEKTKESLMRMVR